MWRRNLRGWLGVFLDSQRAPARSRLRRRVRRSFECLEERIALSGEKVAYLVAGLGGQSGPGSVFPQSFITSLERDNFEVDLANWNSSNYLDVNTGHYYYTTLAATVSITATTIPVLNAAAFPSGMTGKSIQIDSEQMLVTGVTGNTLTVKRGQNGTVAASHLESAGVSLVAALQNQLNGNPGSFSAGVTASFTTPKKVLGISIPSITIPTAVGFQVDIGSPTQDTFVNAAVARLKTFDSQDTIVLIGHSLGGDAVLTVAQDLDQQPTPVPIALLGLLDPVGYASSHGDATNAALGVTDVLTGLSTPSIPYLGIPAIGLQPLTFLNGVSNNSDGTPGFRGSEFGGGLGAVPANVEYLYNRWQTNSFFPIDFPTDGDLTSFAQISDQAVQNTTTPYSVLSTQNPLNFLGLFTPYVDLDPLTFENIGLGVEVPTGFNSDFLKSTAQLHYNFPQNPTVDAQLGALFSDIFANGLVVANTNASGTGSLAQAVSNADISGGGFITFAPGTFATPQTIRLTGTLDLKNTHSGQSITIVGPPAGVTIAGDGGGLSPLFSVFTVAANTTARLEGLTISDGYSTNGGGIDNSGVLTVTDCTISDNGATEDGGGIASSGSLTVTDSTISGNETGVDGGGIFDSGMLTVTDTTISGNIAAISVPVIAIGNGGGIYDKPPSSKSISVTLTNDTITGNGTGIYGGGIDSAYGSHGGPTLTVTNCTITGNNAGTGGGIASTGTLILNNTILAGNDATTDPDLFTDMNSKVGSYDSNSHNLIGGGVSWLAPLGYYGGPIETFALLPGSPAIGAGQPIAAVITDERGFSRSSHPDLGAFQTQGSSLVVTSTADPVANFGQLSLREAVNLANVMPGNNTITFAAAAGQTFASAQTIQLAAGLELDNTTSFFLAYLKARYSLRSSITIDGPAAGITIAAAVGTNFTDFTVAADTIATLDGLTISKLFLISRFFGIKVRGSGIENETGATLTLSNSTVSGNAASGSGGGIDNAGAMTVEYCTISGNQASGGSGGGIDNSGAMTVENSTISGNDADSGSGGGIDNSGTMTVENSTISGNNAASGGGIDNESGATLTLSNDTASGNSALGAAGDGGGIDNSGSMTIENATVVGNSAGSHGGGIWNASGLLVLTGSTIDDNSAPFDGGIGNVGTLTLAGSTIAGNTAQDNVGGLGNSGALTLTESTVSGNSAQDGLGGGIYNDTGATLAIANDTISGNSAQGGGGGIYNAAALTASNDTVSNNSAADGGGIDNVSGTLVLSDTIVAGNTAATNADLDAGGAGYGGNGANLIGTGGSSLAALGSYGGPTQTVALLPGSPAIAAGAAVTTLSAPASAGDTSLSVADGAAIAVSPGDYAIQVAGQQLVVTGVAGNVLTLQSAVSSAIAGGAGVFLATDQRGFSRPATQPDLGAFQTSGNLNLVVTTTADPVANTPLGSFTGGVLGQLSLREAVNLADVLSGNIAIIFAAGTGQAFATPQTITLASSLDLNNTLSEGDMAIEGPPAGVTIAGGGSGSNFSVFTVAAGTTAAIEGLTISGGVSNSNGGGIENSGTLSVSGVTLAHNSAADGGAIDNQGALSLSDSTIADNSATGSTLGDDGGGIDNEAAGTMAVSNATIADNSAGALGGNGGGIFNAGSLTLSNTIVAGNTAKTDADVDGTFGGNKDNMIGTGASSLAALANNGGPTETIALKAGSPALGKGGAVTNVDSDGSVSSVDTTIPVYNGSAIANGAGIFFVRIDSGIDSEIMLVTQATESTLTVERGFFNTAATTHKSQVGVYLATDQRGVLRSLTAPNIGAFEADNTAPLTTFLAATPSALVFGQALQLTAAVTGPEGSPPGYFRFVANGTTLGTASLSAGVATFTTTALPLGTDTVTAVYVPSAAGSDSYTSNAVTVDVGQAGTTVSGVVTPANPQLDVPFTFTATVSAAAPGSGTPTGEVAFQVDGNPPTDMSLVGGSASLVLGNSLSAGTHVLTATYLGDSNFTASAPFTLTLNPSTISGTLTPSDVVPNQAFTFTASVSGEAAGGATPTGFVQFQVDGNPPSEVALADGQASLSFPNGLPASAQVITATYLGDSNFAPSSTFTQTLPFNADVAVTASASSSSFAVGQNFTYTVTVVNNGPEAATGVALTDTLPAGVTLVSAGFNQGSCAIAGGTATWTLGNLADGAGATLTLIVTPTAAAGSTLTDTASVTTTTPEPNLANNTASVVTPLATVTPFVVTNTNASGPGSLAQAILDSNAHSTSGNPGGAPNVIDFDIPADDPRHFYYEQATGGLGYAAIGTTTATDDSTIPNINPDWPHSWYDINLPASFENALPTITTPVIVDGYSQPGASPNSNGPGLGDNAVLTIDLDGSGSVNTVGLDVNAPDCTIQGLAFNNFSGVGLYVAGAAATGDVVQGDFIGTDISGTMAGANAGGLYLDASQSTIGGTTPATRNVISGNNGEGIAIGVSYGPDTGNVIEGNFIGTDTSGALALSNTSGGISISQQSGNTIGGTTPSARNIISGNNSYGISIASGDTTALQNVIEGNYIGTDVTGTIAVPNRGDGVGLNGTPQTTIGGTVAGAGNVISGNTANGVDFFGSSNDLVEGNLIGTAADGVSPLGNGANGVAAPEDSNDIISANVIENNAGAGITIGPYSGTGNAFLGNSIYANGNLGINFGYGVVQNTPGGSDSGPNNVENYPVITVAQSSAAGITIQGTFNSTPNTDGFVLQFFASPKADPSGYGQGKMFLGSTTVNTDQNGNASFTVNFSTAVPVGQVVSATATDPNNNTSEFSLAAPVATAASADLAVTATASANPAVVGANLIYTITVTNNGPGTALAVTLIDTLPVSATLVSAAYSQGNSSIDNGAVTLYLDSLASGASATLTLVVTPTMAATITDTASATADTPDPNLSNNNASVQTTVNPG
ncbi:MAG: beta strand repeat-containing protein [Thermoguttaceae bacterium]